MAIEKMTFIDMTGNSAYLDEVLRRCLRSGIFQPEYASKLSEYSIGSNALLRNPFGGLMIKINEITAALGVKPGAEVFDEITDSSGLENFIELTHQALDSMRGEYPAYFAKRNKINDEIISYTAAVDMLKHISEPDIDFDKLWENRYLKIRFGRMPTANLDKLNVYDEKPYELYKLDSNAVQTWCIYVTAEEYRDDIDGIFHSLAFERLRIPDYVHGTVTSATQYLEKGLTEERVKLEQAVREIEKYIASIRADLLEIYSQTRFLYEAYDLRKYVVDIRDQFHLVGFVLERNEKEFNSLLSGVGTDFAIASTPAAEVARVKVPVQLKNNWFVKPFEMFVNMYGSPSYHDIDPSPFVAYTYSLLFGMMFGDVGHGLVVALLGVLLWKMKKMPLGRIMSRIGTVSTVFGALYGSVFGFEHLLDGFYINVLGLKAKPIEVMHPDTTNKILIAALALGAAIILMVMIFNIMIGAKHRSFDRMVLSHNGIMGLIFYASVLLAGVGAFTNTQLLPQAAQTILIVVPLIVIFFREPITHFIQYQLTGDILKEKSLAETKTFHEGSINFKELFESQYVTARFGRIPTDNFRKLIFYENEPFMLYPVKSEHDYIWCVYAAAYSHKAEIDAIFRDLLFERIYIPDEHLSSNEDAEAYIKSCVDAGGIPGEYDPEIAAKYGPVKTEKPKTVLQAVFPEGIGSFLTQSFFEMFEVALSFVTNTMSFLRVGGFILVHAGMMAVVFTLAEMVGGGASPVIIVIGNLFVMALEGLIVGIQVLRLEFYEIFSRFYDADGEPFMPVTLRFHDD